MKIEFDFPDSVPVDQIDVSFIQGMLNRMAFGYHNYGHMRRYEKVSNSLKNSVIRLCKYAGLETIAAIVDELRSRDIALERTANTEFLMDAANFNMMEFVKPSLPGAQFTATTKDQSPGAIVDGRHVKGREDYLESKRVKREGD
jgi:hypothetical protein